MARYKIYTLADERSPNDIRYIGFTSGKIQKRLNGHIGKALYSKCNYHVTNWVRKLLREGSKPEIKILDFCNKNNWEEYEIYWICQMRAWGFDLTNRHKGGKGYARLTDEQKWNRSQIMKSKMSNPHFKLKYKKAHSKYKKPIVQMTLTGDLIREWSGIKEASRHTKIDSSSIAKACRGIVKTAGKYCWEFKNEKDLIKKKVEYSNKAKKNFKKCIEKSKKPIVQYSLEGQIIKEWPSAADAERALGIFKTAIYNCCNGSKLSAGGFLWTNCGEKPLLNYKEEYMKKFNNVFKPVSQFSLEGKFIKTFKSVSEASIEVNVSVNLISQCCLCKLKSSAGYLWAYEGNIPNKYFRIETKKSILQMSKEDITINKFESIAQAANKTNILKSCISACCRGIQKSAGGFRWKYASDVDGQEYLEK